MWGECCGRVGVGIWKYRIVGSERVRSVRVCVCVCACMLSIVIWRVVESCFYSAVDYPYELFKKYFTPTQILCLAMNSINIIGMKIK